MGTNLKEFKQELRKEQDRIRRIIKNKVSDIVLSVFNALLEPSPLGTPVISGWMKSNWRIGVNDFDQNPVGSKESLNTVAQPQSVTEFLSTDLDQIRTVYIYNQVPYATDVNEGNAKQSPLLFIELSVDRGLRKAGVSANG